MKLEYFSKTYRRRSARKRPAVLSGNLLGNSEGFAGTDTDDRENGHDRTFGVRSGAYNIEYLRAYNIEYFPLEVNVLVYKKPNHVLASGEILLNTSSQFSCFPRGSTSKAKFAGEAEISHMADGMSKGCPCSTSSTARRLACGKGRKRKVKPKDRQGDSEVIVPKRTRFRGQTRRSRNISDTIPNEREKLDSATFLHYFMHLWSAYPEEKVKSVEYLDPLWFQLYANESNRVIVLKWIKEKGIFSKKYVLVPIVMWSHWSLLIFCHFGESQDSKTNVPCMLLLDSMHAIGPTRLEPLIRRLLFDIHVSEGRPESKQQLKKMPLLIPKVPQQKQGEECGFYVLFYINQFIERAPESFNISEGYPYFMKKDWFTTEEVESFCKSLDAFPVVVSDHDNVSMDSGSSVELI